MTAGDGGAAGLPGSLVLVGAGKMGGALLAGWLRAGLPDRAATVLDPHPSEEIGALERAGRIRLNGDAAEIGAVEVVVLGIKPQTLGEAAPALRPLVGPATLLVSILAGKTVANLTAAFPTARAVVRAMPNLPASVGKGATGAYASPATSAAERKSAAALLGCNGTVEWVGAEDEIDAVTALSGSGPAYIFHLVETLAAAGTAAGLERGLADRLARQTVIGSAALLEASPDVSPARLRENVTSPGGTTAAALAVLMGERGLAPLMGRAVAAAKRRAAELSG